jgi:protein tyrosine/serine phosphatase
VDAPTPESYWVEPGRLLAGKYPVPAHDAGANARLRLLLTAGVTLFLDLTQEHELDPYAHLVDSGARHVRMPIHDMDVTTPEQMRRTLDLIDREGARGGTTYVHCWGGAGRTGTVVGCWLVRQGLDGDSALARIAALRTGSPALWLDSPQTDAQRAMVRGWSEPG